MCGRYTLTSSGADIWDLIEETIPDPIRPTRNIIEADFIKKRWQIAPNDWVPAILPQGYMKAHWWLLPSWAKADGFKWRVTGKGEKSYTWAAGKRFSHFNCRFDTLTDPSKSYWYGLLQSQRCLIPASGFIEWSDAEMLKPGEKKKQAYFYLSDKKPFFFAGVYDVRKDDSGKDFPSVNIITTKPNELLSALPHHRMPAILKNEDVKKWMNPTLDNKAASTLLAPLPAHDMAFHFLGPLINKASNNIPEVLNPID